MSSHPPSDWELIRSDPHAHCKVYDVEKERFRHPVDGREGDFFTLKCPDWVLVCPLTTDGHIVLVRQFRFGVRHGSWEMPGGVIDAADADPMIAGPRELTEETGYEGDAPVYLGWCHPNPALQNNRAHFILVENCCLRKGQSLDPNEELQVKAMPLEEAYAMLARGEISHSMAINALFWLKEHMAGRATPTGATIAS